MSAFSDKRILDWLQSKVKRKGAWQALNLSDSRDMGYRKGCLAMWGIGHEVNTVPTSENVRGVLSNAMRKEGIK